MGAPQEKLVKVKPRHGLVALNPGRGVARCKCGAVFTQGTAGISSRATADLLLDIYTLHRKAMRKLLRRVR